MLLRTGFGNNCDVALVCPAKKNLRRRFWKFFGNLYDRWIASQWRVWRSSEGRICLKQDVIVLTILLQFRAVTLWMPFDLIQSRDDVRMLFEVFKMFDHEVRHSDRSDQSLLLEFRQSIVCSPTEYRHLIRFLGQSIDPCKENVNKNDLECIYVHAPGQWSRNRSM